MDRSKWIDGVIIKCLRVAGALTSYISIAFVLLFLFEASRFHLAAIAVVIQRGLQRGDLMYSVNRFLVGVHRVTFGTI